MTRSDTPEPWPDHGAGDPPETLVTGPTARRVLGPARPGPHPWPRDPAWQQSEPPPTIAALALGGAR